jgi:phosphonate metabolism protein (transferase hexapeptide repeat family)
VADKPFVDPATATKRLGQSPSVDPTARLRDARLGAWTEVGARCVLTEVELGDYAYVVHDTQITYASIGRFCSIASHCRINPGNHPLDRVALNHFTYRASAYGLGEDEAGFFDWRRSHRVTLGPDVWLGHGVVVLPGVTIGAGAAIGAGAIVTKDVPPFAVAAGNPARLLRFRFTRPVIESLLRIGWWDWPRDRLAEGLEEFRRSSAAQFCARHDPAFCHED